MSLAAASAVLVAIPAHAELMPASQDEILAGVRSCVASVGPAGLDEASLVADGWLKGSVVREGKAVAPYLVIYGKGNIMMLSARTADAKPQLCTVVARVGTVRDLAALQATIATAYGAPFAGDGKGEEVFQAADHRFIDFATTGTTDRPSARIAVTYVSPEKK